MREIAKDKNGRAIEVGSSVVCVQRASSGTLEEGRTYTVTRSETYFESMGSIDIQGHRASPHFAYPAYLFEVVLDEAGDQ